MIAIGVELGRTLSCFHDQRLGMLSLLAHDIAERKNLHIGSEQIFKQAGASSARADDADPGIFYRSELVLTYQCSQTVQICVEIFP
jgi:hypothetical protein